MQYNSIYKNVPFCFWWKQKQKKKRQKKKKGENVPSLEVVAVVLGQCNLVDTQCQQKSQVLNAFMPIKSYAYLLHAEPSN